MPPCSSGRWGDPLASVGPSRYLIARSDNHFGEFLMATAVQPSTVDTTDLSVILRGSVILGVIQSVAVFAVSLVNRSLEGTADHALTGVIVAIGAALSIVLPGIWTRARTIEGISGAAGIGLGAALVYMLIDVIALQPLGTYTNRWHEVGGGSNWWYHPVWWMVASYISWLGAFIMANQAARKGEASVAGTLILTAICTAVCGAAAAALHFPGAGWNVPTFAVASLAGLPLATLVSGLGGARS